MIRSRLTLSSILLLSCILRAFAIGADTRKFATSSVTKKVFHLGNDKKKDWKKFTKEEPHAENRIEVAFDAKKNASEQVLKVRSGDVNSSWYVRVNGKRLDKLEKNSKGKGELTQFVRIPPRLLKTGKNLFVVERDTSGTDDIWVGPVILEARRLASALRLSELKVRVHDAATGAGLPCRITVTRPEKSSRKGEGREKLVELSIDKSDRVAVRKGVVYSLDGAVDLRLPGGRYHVYATRGFEYGLGRTQVDLSTGEARTIEMTVEREVDTTGFLASDTHVHTVTYSKHGDATVEERVVSIVGEGVEVAVATDHNHHTDYRDVEKKVGTVGRFRSIIGNEFTTSLGHFNAFPIDKGAKPAKHDHREWTRLLKGLRETPGVRVVICNHPRRPSYAKGPWGKRGVNEITGELAGDSDWLGLDAVEVINGKGLMKEPELNFRDWFHLLNRGYRLVAVAGSDSHTVDQPVGQSRTYVRSKTDDPERVDVSDLVDSFLSGRLLVSMGLLTQVRVDGKFSVGDIAVGDADDLDVEITVSAPRWIRAENVALYLNGLKVREEKIEHGADDIVKHRKIWKLSRPHYDAHLVVIATGPPVEGPYWAFEEDDRYVIGATNPVWIDGDGDGEFTSSRGYAEALLAEHGTNGAPLREALRTYDATVAVQTVSLVRRRLEIALQKLYDHLQTRANEELREIFPGSLDAGDSDLRKLLEGLPSIDVETVRERLEKKGANKGKKKKGSK